jgi:hypothetical protein
MGGQEMPAHRGGTCRAGGTKSVMPGPQMKLISENSRMLPIRL